MREELLPPIVEDVHVAIVKEHKGEETQWWVYLINMKEVQIDGVLVTSTGYGEQNGENVRTSTIRRHLHSLKPKSYKPIEPIMENLFHLHNEFWVSFFLDFKLYDKKYIFLRETINDAYLTNIPIINKKGVMIK